MMDSLPFTHLIKTLELIRDSFEGATIIYTQGSCLKLAMILKHLYPSGKILYDLSHAIFEYDGNYYDINGFAKKTDNHIPIEDYGLLQAYNSMNIKYKSDFEKKKVITRLIKTINKYWNIGDLDMVIYYTNRLKKVAERVL